MEEWTPENIALLRRQMKGWEEIAKIKAKELANMTDEEAARIIGSLSAVERWDRSPNWSGLVEQQEHFKKLRGCSN